METLSRPGLMGHEQSRPDSVEEVLALQEKCIENKVGIARELEDSPACAICTDVLGTWGGPASLVCGHNGCLECLQKVQKHSALPVCPLCRTPFGSDQNLGLNTDLRDALERAQVLEVVVRNAEAEHERLAAAVAAQHSVSEQTRRGKFFFYDLPLPEETGAWIPVSVPPMSDNNSAGYVVEANGHEGGFFPEDCSWLGESANRDAAPELTMWSILTEMIAVACGARKYQGRHGKQVETEHQVSWDHGNGNSLEDDSVLDEGWRDAFDPGASLLADEMEDHVRSMRAVLVAEPPQWLPDSSASICMQCALRFHPITCPRHHCRLCGGIFCGVCSTRSSLLPVKFRERTPQRVCDSCWEKLEPVQGILREQVSQAAQLATHDVTDLSCLRSWVNSPLSVSMEHEIYKATNTLRGYLEIGKLKPERSIPDVVLKGAKGLAIITVLKAGMMVTYKVGTGLVVARGKDGAWSAPSAIASCGIGWGAQAGGELTDFIIVLRTEAAVKAFSGKVHFSFGAGLSAAAGPVGRTVEADICLGDGGTAACYTYSRSKGVFVGCSLEGNVVSSRTATNAEFYGDPHVRAVDILLGPMQRPKAAVPLYDALANLFKT